MISIIGGTYQEVNLEHNTFEIFGSGLRSSYFFLENKIPVHFHTSGNSKIKDLLEEYKKVYNNFNYSLKESDLITFKYDFPIDNPRILPNPLTISTLR